MKMSNSIRYAVVVAVLGLSVALSAPHAFAAEYDYKVYPAAMCGRVDGANISRNAYGGIQNLNPTLTRSVEYRARGNVFMPLHKVSLASHIRQGKFGEVWTEVWACR
jgi:hypothetical protein